ncbi:MAG: NRDE family protein, partial [Flavobacteriaceae bacterium]
DLKNMKNDAPSRGNLTLGYLLNTISPEEYYENLQPTLYDYNGFNLLLGDADNLYYFSNKTDGIQKLSPGIHGISNAILNTPWPKVEKAKQKLESLLKQEDVHPFEVIDILKNTTIAKDEDLPDTGVGLELERMLSSIFIKSEKYGTRCSSVLMVDKENNVQFVEKFFFGGLGTFSNREFKFKINS